MRFLVSDVATPRDKKSILGIYKRARKNFLKPLRVSDTEFRDGLNNLIEHQARHVKTYRRTGLKAMAGSAADNPNVAKAGVPVRD
jgi:hypothetical protein